MRILFVESYPQVMMGQQRTLLALLAQCQSKNIEPVVACTDDGLFTQTVKGLGYETLIFSYPDKINVYGGEIYRYGFKDKIKTYLQVGKYILSLKDKLKANHIDVVYCNDMRGLLTVGVAAKRCGIPVVIWDKLDKPHGWLDKLQLPLVSKNIIISDSVLNKYPKLQQKIFSRKIEKVMEGVFIEQFTNVESVRAEFETSDDDVVIAIVGSISERKGHDRLFSIFPQLVDVIPNLKLWVVGEAGNSKKEQQFFEKLPNKGHPNIKFVGFRNDIPQIMNSIDILAVPSRYEGMGMVIVEAMAASKPVVGANCGGIPEVINNDETGYIFNGNDLSDFNHKLLTLCKDKSIRIEMGNKGYQRVISQFDRKEQLNKVIQILKKVNKNDN